MRRRGRLGFGEEEDNPAEYYGMEPGRGRDPLSLKAGDIDVKNPHTVSEVLDLTRDPANVRTAGRVGYEFATRKT